VNTVFPSVNCPFGNCFCRPEMRACSFAKVVALDLLDVVLDMTFSPFTEGALRQD
jgi:hypothetical protein